MNLNESKASNVLGGKTARACDSCLMKRARWFCAADDAFLCQSCDAAVHSANQLASRHQRLRLDTSSCKPSSAPAWHTKKARTPRQPKSARLQLQHQLPLVPEMGSEEPFLEENDEQLFCRVPVFDDEFGVGNMVFDDEHDACRDLNIEELLGSCEGAFAADVESLLGAGIDGLLDEKRVKVEEKDDDEVVIACHLDPEFDCTTNSTIVELGEEMKNVEMIQNVESQVVKKRMLLKLNYEAVIAAWATQGSPWTDGIRPLHFNLDEFMAACLGGSSDERKWAGREARVSRYREKRRTRLFSKKIRYEVRKLNAEKRPRMKGRFVKRTPYLPYQFINN